jgi:hypothetical protein
MSVSSVRRSRPGARLGDELLDSWRRCLLAVIGHYEILE